VLVVWVDDSTLKMLAEAKLQSRDMSSGEDISDRELLLDLLAKILRKLCVAVQ